MVGFMRGTEMPLPVTLCLALRCVLPHRTVLTPPRCVPHRLPVLPGLCSLLPAQLMQILQTVHGPRLDCSDHHSTPTLAVLPHRPAMIIHVPEARSRVTADSQLHRPLGQRAATALVQVLQAC